MLNVANRLLRHLPELVKPDQVEFGPGHQAPDTTRIMINLMHHVEHNQRSSLLLTLDAEKTFDMVHWGYLSQVLKKIGIQGKIFNVITALYIVPLAYVYGILTTFSPKILKFPLGQSRVAPCPRLFLLSHGNH